MRSELSADGDLVEILAKDSSIYWLIDLGVTRVRCYSLAIRDRV